MWGDGPSFGDTGLSRKRSGPTFVPALIDWSLDKPVFAPQQKTGD